MSLLHDEFFDIRTITRYLSSKLAKSPIHGINSEFVHLPKICPRSSVNSDARTSLLSLEKDGENLSSAAALCLSRKLPIFHGRLVSSCFVALTVSCFFSISFPLCIHHDTVTCFPPGKLTLNRLMFPKMTTTRF